MPTESASNMQVPSPTATVTAASAPITSTAAAAMPTKRLQVRLQGSWGRRLAGQPTHTTSSPLQPSQPHRQAQQYHRQPGRPDLNQLLEHPCLLHTPLGRPQHSLNPNRCHPLGARGPSLEGRVAEHEAAEAGHHCAREGQDRAAGRGGAGVNATRVLVVVGLHASPPHRQHDHGCPIAAVISSRAHPSSTYKGTHGKAARHSRARNYTPAYLQSVAARGGPGPEAAAPAAARPARPAARGWRRLRRRHCRGGATPSCTTRRPAEGMAQYLLHQTIERHNMGLV